MAFKETEDSVSEHNSMLRVACYTLGCKVNGYESQAMLEQFERAGCQVVSSEEEADVYLVNTCTVTHIAAHKSRQMLHRMRTRNPLALIVACGCYVDQNIEASQSLDGLADLIISNRDKEHIVKKVFERLQKDPVLPAEEEGFFISDAGSHTRAFLKVQDGCRQFCSYCIIPYVRGPLKSKPLSEAVQEARTLAKNGIREIVLTGIHLSSYGRDLEDHPSLPDLILALDAIDGLERIRLGSLEVGLITDEYIEAVKKSTKLCPHYHLSLQSGAAATLKAMNRRYTPEEFKLAADKLRGAFPDVALTTDVIVGFPGETEQDFEESARFIKEIGFADLHVFPYSARGGTAAARRTDLFVDDGTKRSRSEAMIAIAKESELSFARQFVGQTLDVLIEQPIGDDSVWEGYTANYLRVRVALPEGPHQNTLVPVQIHSVVSAGKGTYLMGVYHAGE